MTIRYGFAEYLKPRLPLGCNLRVHHVSAQPTSCPPLFAAAPGRADEETWCESHFLTLSQTRSPTSGSEGHGQTVVFGLEVLVFTSPDLITVFVSKADSTGLLVRQDGPGRFTSVAHAATAAFLEFLTEPRRSETRVVLSLFARSQNQYLFPGSIENTTKHVLDDRQLIKWWCRVLDTLMIKVPETSKFDANTRPQAFVVIPGCDKSETRAFFPPSARSDPSTEPRWRNRYPVDILAKDVSLPPRCLVPRLPDDPKSRFLDDLDDSQSDEAGTWRGVKTLDQFWELMSYRQECSAGRLVGFVWLIFEKHYVTQTVNTASDINPPNLSASTNKGDNAPVGQNPTTAANNDETNVVSESFEKHTQPAKESPRWPVSTRGQIVLKSEDYSTLTDHLLQLDFAGEDTAAASTKDWIEKAMDLSKQDEFGTQVIGQLPAAVQVVAKETLAVTNVITAVRKKRKANTNDNNGTTTATATATSAADSNNAKQTLRAEELISQVEPQDISRKKVKS